MGITLPFSPQVLVFADQAVFSGSSFVLSLLLARLLGPDVFGAYSALMLGAYLVVTLTGAAVMQPYQVLQATFRQSSYEAFVFWLNLALLAAVCLVLAGLLRAGLPGWKAGGHGLLLLAGFSFHDFLRKAFLAKAAVTHALLLDLLAGVGQVGIVVLALLTEHPAFTDLLLGLGLAYLPGFGLALYLLRPSFPGREDCLTYLRAHIHTGKWLILTALVQWWSGNLFVVAAGVMLGTGALGAFRLVQSLFGVFSILFQTLENYHLPEVSRQMAQSRTAAKTYLVRLTLRFGGAFGALLAGLVLFPQQVLLLAGGQAYASYTLVVQGMAVLYLFIFLGYPVRLAVRALHLNKDLLAGYVLSAVFGLAASRFLLLHGGLLGVLAGLTVSQLIVLGYWQYILSKNNFVLWK